MKEGMHSDRKLPQLWVSSLILWGTYCIVESQHFHQPCFSKKPLDATCPPDDKTGDLLVEEEKPQAAKESYFCQEFGENFLDIKV